MQTGVTVVFVCFKGIHVSDRGADPGFEKRGGAGGSGASF